jgi:hypothetical protein
MRHGYCASKAGFGTGSVSCFLLLHGPHDPPRSVAGVEHDGAVEFAAEARIQFGQAGVNLGVLGEDARRLLESGDGIAKREAVGAGDAGGLKKGESPQKDGGKREGETEGSFQRCILGDRNRTRYKGRNWDIVRRLTPELAERSPIQFSKVFHNTCLTSDKMPCFTAER